MLIFKFVKYLMKWTASMSEKSLIEVTAMGDQLNNSPYKMASL